MRYHMLLAVALLLPAPAVWAQPRHDDPYDYGYQTQPYPADEQLSHVQSLGHELEDASRHTYRDAVASRDRFTWREDRAIRRLDKLADWAGHFHHQVESYRQDPAHTEEDFQDLVRAYMRDRDAVHRDLHATTRVRDDFRRVETIMEHLTGYYGCHG